MTNKKTDREGYVFSQNNPSWLQPIAPENILDMDLFRIIIFFIFYSPCENLSARSKTLEMYGWKDPWKKPTYLNRRLKDAATNSKLLFSVSSLNVMRESLEKAYLLDNFPNNLHEERICVYNNMKNQFISVFYHIRNSFAHGRFNIVDSDEECVFVFEDKTIKEMVSARFILKKATLLKWIDIIERGY